MLTNKYAAATDLNFVITIIFNIIIIINCLTSGIIIFIPGTQNLHIDTATIRDTKSKLLFFYSPPLSINKSSQPSDNIFGDAHAHSSVDLSLFTPAS